MSQENVHVVRAAVEAFERGDMEAALAAADPGLVITRVDPDGSVFHGPEGFLQMLSEWSAQFTGLTYRGDEFIDAGERVVARLRQTARGAVSRVPVEGEYWLVYTVERGLVTRLEVYSEKRDAFRAAGLSG